MNKAHLTLLVLFIASAGAMDAYAASSAPVIKTQPVDVTVTSPVKATFKVVVTASPAPAYQWMIEVPGAGSFTAIAGATSASYTTPVTSLTDSGTQFECVITNSLGSITSDIVTLTVYTKPAITTQPVSQTVTSPAAAAFTVAASGTPAVAYQWQEAAPGTTSYTNIAGADSSSFTSNPTAVTDSGTKFKCVITNAAGSVTTTAAVLTVYAFPDITTQPVNTTVVATTKAVFTIAAMGTPTPKYQWMQEAPGAASFSNVATGGTAATYTTPATTVANSGTQYECVVTNAAGRVTSNAVTLTVNPAVAPSITTQPAGQTVVAPAAATFTVVASGAPSPAYQWQEKAPGATTYTAITGATSSSYTTPATALSNSGALFRCVVRNSAGSVTSAAAALTVIAAVAPSFTAQPVSATVTSPATATFSVTATGTPAPAYQWMESVNGGAFTNITGATGFSYTTPATSTSDNGTQFECVITNQAGSMTSNPAALTVNSAPIMVAITFPANNTGVATTSLYITATASETNGTIASVSFYNGTTLLGTSTNAPYSYSWGVPEGTYTLTAVATDTNGVSAKSSPVTVTITGIPTVNITQPLNNSIFTAGSNMLLTAAASEENGSIQSVAFYENGYLLLGTSTTPPYTCLVGGLSPGTYSIEAVATDMNGYFAYSASDTITVNGQPVITMASPDNGANLATGSLNVTAVTGGTDITNVAFYNGQTLLGSVNSKAAYQQAFTYSWANIPSGAYMLTSVATDVTGAATTSPPVSVTVNSSNFTSAVDDNVASATDPRGNTTDYQYDNDNRLTKIVFADQSTVSYAYDPFGNETAITDQRGDVLTRTYDAYDRLIQSRDPLGNLTQFGYDINGNLLQLTDANNHATTYTYDQDNRVLAQTNALNYATSYTYDPVGNIATRQDANGKTTIYTYDALNRLTNISYPDGSGVANVYDALGNRTSMTDSTGQTSYTYDALSRLLSKTMPGSNNTIFYTYDGEGNRLTAVDQNNRTITNTYDALNRLSTVQDQNGTTAYAYDTNSNQTSVALPNGATENYTYDALNRVLTAVNTAGGATVSSFANQYDAAGMITQKTFADGTYKTYSYDAINELLSETYQNSSGVVFSNVYTYDPVGNRLTLTKNTTLGDFWTDDYQNMPAQVLTNLNSSGYGDTANQTQAVNLARTYSYDAANRLSGWNYNVNIYSASFPVQTDTYTYDNNGNRLTKQAVLSGQETSPEQTNYSYDFENRLDALQYTNIPNITGTQTDNLTYSGEGLRVQWQVNSTGANGTSPMTSNYLYDGPNILNERDGSGNATKTYTRGLDLGGGIGSLIAQNYSNNGNPTVSYYSYDNLGSVSNLTDASGASIYNYKYDAYGNLIGGQTSGDTNRYLFSSKEFDGRSGLSYFGGRYYDSEIGRWLTQDPLGFVNGPNMYAYVGNNPLNWIDPYGLDYDEGPNKITEGGGGGYGGGGGGAGWGGGGGEGEGGGGGTSSTGGGGCPPSLTPANGSGNGGPQPSPNFITPTNEPQLPPEQLPPGWTIRSMPNSTSQYQNGYWVMYNEYGQPVDISTGKPPGNVTRPVSRSRTHVPYP